MHHPRSLAQVAQHLLLGALFAALAVPAAASPQAEAAKVAKKVEKARSPRHQAKKDADAVAEFEKEVRHYAELHDRLIARLSQDRPVTGGELTEAIMAARSKAEPSDIFVPEVQPLLKRLIAEQLLGPDAIDARKAVKEGNPVAEGDPVKVDVRVNAPYPSGAAHSTMPPSLLLVLPVLPPWLHYRFVGRDLVLVDSVAQLIVDFLPNAAPAIAIRKIP
ncbi:MAG: hypothetical protein ABI565_05400 [Vicinamibacteria bacterium]